MRTRDRVIESIVDQFGFNREQANHIYLVMVKNKALLPDRVNGGWSLSHGAYWDKRVMNNALNMEA